MIMILIIQPTFCIYEVLQHSSLSCMFRRLITILTGNDDACYFRKATILLPPYTKMQTGIDPVNLFCWCMSETNVLT